MSTASADVLVLQIEVAAAWAPGRIDLTALRLPAGATVADALRASGLLARIGAEALDALTPGVWGRACGAHTLLHDGDRIELTRRLTVDPKEARRLRYRRDGLRKPVKPRA